MTKIIKQTSCLVLFLALVITNYSAFAETLRGKVVGVSDGDTITLLDATNTQHKIRVTGIDAPEKAQAFGQASKKSLSDLVFSRNVEIFWEKRDRYQRILGKVLIKEQDICLEQVKRGMAWHYKQYQRDQPLEDRIKYSKAEEEARQKRIGLWADEAPMPPSEFRHKK